jgi:Site-specific DNA methylase
MKSTIKVRYLTPKKVSPLRYPGGKSILTDFLARFTSWNGLKDTIYIEPYAGGAGAALNLLFYDKVKQIVINDANIAIFSFWNSLINHSEAFLKKFDSINPTLREWKKQKTIFEKHKNDKTASTELGFATFFLNRTNRSGILSATPIGGKTQKKQLASKYTIKARYNKKDLRKRLCGVISFKERIKVSNEDALALLKKFSRSSRNMQQKTLIYLDPPYYVNGKKLYMDFYNNDDHRALASFLEKSKMRCKWLLSYDNVVAIKKLYRKSEQYFFTLRYSASTARKGKELLMHSNNSIILEKFIFKKGKKKKIFLKKIKT